MSSPTAAADPLEPQELGTLIVVVGKARNLPNKSRFGKQDPFCSIKIGNEKHKTKAIKRGGQHPEWDEELRFTIKEDLDEVLARSESKSDVSLSASTSTLSGKEGSEVGVATAASLASKSRKGPINKKAGRKMNLAVYADDAKEPDLIGECSISFEDVLKKGEVDEWYELSFKERYSGEVYLEMTFFSNKAPPVKRNPTYRKYAQSSLIPAGSLQSLSLSSASRPSMATLASSGSVTGMNLYIPPYAEPARQPSPAPQAVPAMPSTHSFAQLGLPQSHQRNSLPDLPGAPGFPPSSSSRLSISSSSTHSGHTADPMDALTRPLSSLSLASNHSTAGPSQPDLYNLPHRHSLPATDAPWSSLLAPNQSRPHSSNEVVSWNQAQWDGARSNAATPLARPASQAYSSQQYPSGSFSAVDPRAPSPLPVALQAGPKHQHAHSFSGISNAPHPSTYLQPHPPPPLPSNSAPPTSQPPGHYAIPSSSFASIAQALEDPYRSATPMNPYRVATPQPPGSPYVPPHQEQSYSATSASPQIQQWQAPTPPRRQSTPVTSGSARPVSQSYVPWHQQTQPTPPPQPPRPPSAYAPSYPAHAPTPPPVPDYNRPAPVPPPPPRPVSGYYPSDQLYQQNQQESQHAYHNQPQPPPHQQYAVHDSPPAAHSAMLQQGPWQDQYPPQAQPQYQPADPHRQPSPGPPQPPAQFYQSPTHGAQYGSSANNQPVETPPRRSQDWQSTVGSTAYAPPLPSPLSQSQSTYQPPYQSTSPAPAGVYGRSPSPQPPPRSYAPEGWQSSLALPPSSSVNGHTSPSGDPSSYRAPSPSLPAIPSASAPRQDWKSYMQSLQQSGNPIPPRASSPLPQPIHQPLPQHLQGQVQGHGQGQEGWYTPPPSLPSSIRPPDGWNSSVGGDGGWRN